MTSDYKFQDSLYGLVDLPADLADLVAMPIVQRLRHVRLSNIDSTDMPGIANLSRFEHVLGVAYLATQIGLRRRIPTPELLVIGAAALLHDWAITAFGHLVEEALQYAGTGFDHERRLKQIVDGELPYELGGVSRQIIRGRETGLSKWATRAAGSVAEGKLLIASITEHILGSGTFGKIIAGTIDLDNTDNLFRMAHHMGLAFERDVPLRLARAIVNVDRATCEPIFLDSAETDIEAWCTMRRHIYERLMPAPRDFAAKLMILFATINAVRVGEISNTEWALTDYDIVQRFLSSANKEVKETAERWLVGELWDTAPLVWFSGRRPDYLDILKFSEYVSGQIGRDCLAYAIKDKRHRQLAICFESGKRREFDQEQTMWLLGVGSPRREPFTSKENQTVLECASQYFKSKVIGLAVPEARDGSQSCLL